MMVHILQHKPNASGLKRELYVFDLVLAHVKNWVGILQMNFVGSALGFLSKFRADLKINLNQFIILLVVNGNFGLMR